MFLGMDIYSWIAAIVIALIVTFLPITLPFKIVLAMVAMACFYFGRKYYHNHKNGGAETPSMSSAESEALASGIQIHPRQLVGGEFLPRKGLGLHIKIPF